MSRATASALAAAVVMAVLAVRFARPAESPLPRPARSDSEHWARTIPPVRVLLASRAKKQWKVRVDGPYWVQAEGDFRVLAQGENLPESVTAAHAQGVQIGGQAFPARRLKIDVKNSGTLWLDGHRYRGSLQVLAQPDGRLMAVNVVALEDYLASVLPSEMPASFPAAAQRAQVIISRSYALFQMKTYGRGNFYDVYDSVRSQKYLGVEYVDDRGRRLAVESDHSRRVVQATDGIVLAYRDRLFAAYYSAVCGGHTLQGEAVFGQAAPPLVGVPCEWCREGPNYRWTKEVRLDEVDEKLRAHWAHLGRPLGTLESVSVEDRGSGSVPMVRFKGSLGEHATPATALRRQVFGGMVPSSAFRVKLDGQTLKLDGRGWGHGVGLCQWGARGLALRAQCDGDFGLLLSR